MNMEERFIASVDLGTYKVAVCIARIQDQNVQVVYYKETPSQGIRNSYVLNPKKVENILRTALTQAQQEMRLKISQVIVGLPRYYVRQESASAGIQREDEDSQIQESELRALKSEALKTYPLDDKKNEVIYGAVAQSFSTEDNFNEIESEIVGMTAGKLEGNFKVFIGSRRHSANIDNIFSGMGMKIAKKYFTPGITAKAILKEEQMENGVALFDLGAGVSSVTIFEGRIMRYYAAIPFGGNSITNDIKTECGISFELAENIKKGYGACIHDKLSSFGNKTLQINDENDNTGIQVGVKYISQIIDARMKEIIEALLYGIQESGYADKIRSGIVVTGSGVEMVNCVNFIKEISGCMVSIGTPKPFFSSEGCQGVRSAGASTTMGMILAAKSDRTLNCTSRPPVGIVRPPVQDNAKTPAQPAAPAAAKPAREVAPVPAAETPATEVPQKAEEQKVKKAEPEAVPDWFELPYVGPVKETQDVPVASVDETTVIGAEGIEDNGLEGTVFEKAAEENVSRKPVKNNQDKAVYTWFRKAKKKIASNMNTLFDEMEEEV